MKTVAIAILTFTVGLATGLRIGNHFIVGTVRNQFRSSSAQHQTLALGTLGDSNSHSSEHRFGRSVITTLRQLIRQFRMARGFDSRMLFSRINGRSARSPARLSPSALTLGYE